MQVVVEFPSTEEEGSNCHVTVGALTVPLSDVKTRSMLEVLLRWRRRRRLRHSYLTDSVNSVFFRAFVSEQKVCGAVSYNLYENSTAAYEVVFSNVQRGDVARIKPAFDALIQEYACSLSFPQHAVRRY